MTNSEVKIVLEAIKNQKYIINRIEELKNELRDLELELTSSGSPKCPNSVDRIIVNGRVEYYKAPKQRNYSNNSELNMLDIMSIQLEKEKELQYYERKNQYVKRLKQDIIEYKLPSNYEHNILVCYFEKNYSLTKLGMEFNLTHPWRTVEQLLKKVNINIIP